MTPLQKIKNGIINNCMIDIIDGYRSLTGEDLSEYSTIDNTSASDILSAIKSLLANSEIKPKIIVPENYEDYITEEEQGKTNVLLPKSKTDLQNLELFYNIPSKTIKSGQRYTQGSVGQKVNTEMEAPYHTGVNNKTHANQNRSERETITYLNCPNCKFDKINPDTSITRTRFGIANQAAKVYRCPQCNQEFE